MSYYAQLDSDDEENSYNDYTHQPPTVAAGGPFTVGDRVASEPGDFARFNTVDALRREKSFSTFLNDNTSSTRETGCVVLASRLMFTPMFSTFYLILIGIAICMFLIEVSIHAAFDGTDFSETHIDMNFTQGLDIAITLMMAFEIFIRLKATRKGLFDSIFNVMDAVVALLSLASAIFILLNGAYETNEDILGSTGLFTRYCVAIGRIIVLMKHHRERKKIIGASLADLTISRDYVHVESAVVGDIGAMPSDNIVIRKRTTEERNASNINQLVRMPSQTGSPRTPSSPMFQPSMHIRNIHDLKDVAKGNTPT